MHPQGGGLGNQEKQCQRTAFSMLIDTLCEVYVPGQILWSRESVFGSLNEQQINAYRLPKPKQIVRGSVSGSFPPLAKKRSGLNSEGLAYVRGSWSMNLSPGQFRE